MDIKIIPLASKKITLRKISSDMLEETVRKPDQIIEGYGNRLVRQKIYNINNKKKLLRVIYEESNEGIIIVTAYLTSQIKKYLK